MGGNELGTGDDWLVLRPYTLGDVADVTAACQDREISRWTAVIPWPYEEAHARTWIQSHDQLRETKEAFPFAVVEAESGRFLGTIGSTARAIRRAWPTSATGLPRGRATRASLLAPCNS